MIDPREAKAARPVLRRDVSYRPVGTRFRQNAPPDAAAPREPERPRRAAVMIVHGMGQQVPFETLEQLTARLTAMDSAPAQDERPAPTLTNAAFGDLRLQRAEVVLRDRDRCLETHLYEAYWAPTTEGRVFFFDVVKFCLRGTWNALRRLLVPFHRSMFGRRVKFHHPVAPFLILAILTVAVLEVAILNLLMLALAAVRVLGLLWPNPQMIRSINVEVAALLFLVVAGFAAILLAVFVAGRRERGLWRDGTALLALLLAGAAGLASLVVLPAIVRVVLDGWKPPDWLTEPLSWAAAGRPAIAIWLGVIVSSLVVRHFVVQYVGDVAAYVSPQALDRFSDLRAEIKNGVCRIASAILGAETPDGDFEYDRVAFVGHSLGSVITYDVLNRLILDDGTGASFLDAEERVRLLLTFGSPLDKTAMIFGLNAQGTGVLREQMAARVQPLIEDYAHRKLSWVNVFATLDLFSGRLDFYDDPKDPLYPSRRVVNVRDGAATVPLAAHEQYWDTRAVWTLLHRELFDPGITAQSPPKVL